jgi:oxygen-independent coproporphyrinogen-3 oxidase
MPNPNLIPLSLYIHIPWCVKKCPYCDFNSHESRTTIDFVGYVDALLDDLKTQLSFVQGRKIATIFIGGGTPSLLPALLPAPLEATASQPSRPGPQLASQAGQGHS